MKKIMLCAFTAVALMFGLGFEARGMNPSLQKEFAQEEMAMITSRLQQLERVESERFSSNVENVRQHYSFKKLLPGNINLLRGVALNPSTEVVIVEQSPKKFLYIEKGGTITFYGTSFGGTQLMGETPIGRGLVMNEPDSEKQFFISVGLDNEALEEAVIKAYQYGYIEEIKEIKNDC